MGPTQKRLSNVRERRGAGELKPTLAWPFPFQTALNWSLLFELRVAQIHRLHQNLLILDTNFSLELLAVFFYLQARFKLCVHKNQSLASFRYLQYLERHKLASVEILFVTGSIGLLSIFSAGLRFGDAYCRLDWTTQMQRVQKEQWKN